MKTTTVEPRYNETLYNLYAFITKNDRIALSRIALEYAIRDEVTALSIRNSLNKSGFSIDTVSPNSDCEEKSKKLDLNQFAYKKERQK
ncbi:hypothetical protein BpHYR1_035767 [Brachionus plicatilis]|uniref:Uncharacterized protein n=1 Tax=Brachionus plicatilis TaxID=10195 RepID=A0A3M7Q8I0_BRAPC|nr:hypothetical protein BpHYR1_035767 [Brachionus plicatilis]